MYTYIYNQAPQAAAPKPAATGGIYPPTYLPTSLPTYPPTTYLPNPEPLPPWFPLRGRRRCAVSGRKSYPPEPCGEAFLLRGSNPAP